MWVKHCKARIAEVSFPSEEEKTDLIQESFDRQPWCWTVLLFCTERRRRGERALRRLRDIRGKTLSFTWEFSIFSVKSAYCAVECVCRSSALLWPTCESGGLFSHVSTAVVLQSESGETQRQNRGEVCRNVGIFLSCVMCLFKRKWYGWVYVNVPELFFSTYL